MQQPQDAALLAAYKAKIERGEIKDDPAQRDIVGRLDAILEDVSTYRLASKKSALGWLFGRKKTRPSPRGLYVHGDVGRGKTMLMDMFFDRLPVKRKRRAHFNDFMADAHDRIHAHRQKLARGETRESDPVPPVADSLFEEAWVLCFDEFAVTDIADAMLLSRLFERLFERGAVLVATSNVAPENLYRDGLNRQLFLPFIDLLKRHADVVSLDAPTDYRLEKSRRLPVFHHLGQGEGEAGLDEAWKKVVDGRAVSADRIERKGRSIVVPRATSDAARFTFSQLCDAPLGASDYLAIADKYPTIFIDKVPEIKRGDRNRAKRFILLVDVLYDKRNRLFLSAEVPIVDIYATGTGTEKFEFSRTISRLSEMQDQAYLDASRAA
ncbi:cell division protein ZapE [Pseudohoeflea suaedae]|uniref:Cell division protein ZapE n=1 Tax=Pseudohoeflea suaedae TaxID=877384 RepID=A0A4R5PL81_9HYPH|nr:cell division protein ZapE [Pseudohoeflea suaedae]TDH37684.1 cell division protein ZapE [Pseudohoeflea suaedae]